MNDKEFQCTYETLLLLALDAGLDYQCSLYPALNELILDLAIPCAVKALKEGREDLARRVCDEVSMSEILGHLYEYHRYDDAPDDLPAFALLLSIATEHECENFAYTLREDLREDRAYYYAQEWLDLADAHLDKLMLERLPESKATTAKGGKRL